MKLFKEYCCSSKHAKSTNIEKYQVLSTDEIVEYVVDYVQEVNNIVQVTNCFLMRQYMANYILL